MKKKKKERKQFCETELGHKSLPLDVNIASYKLAYGLPWAPLCLLVPFCLDFASG